MKSDGFLNGHTPVQEKKAGVTFVAVRDVAIFKFPGYEFRDEKVVGMSVVDARHADELDGNIAKAC